MAVDKLASAAWSQTLVRHVDSSKWNDIYRVEGLIRTPFPRGSSVTAGPGWTDLSNLRHWRNDSWVLAPVFAGQSWIPLFSNLATSLELYDLNSRAESWRRPMWAAIPKGVVGVS